MLSYTTDSIPFVLQKDVVASIDTIPANDFYSYEYLPLDSSKLFYAIERIGEEVFFSGLEGITRPFIQQIGGVLFLVFTILFVFVVVFIIHPPSSLSPATDAGDFIMLLCDIYPHGQYHVRS